MSDISEVTVLVTGSMNERVPARVGEIFRFERIERGDPALLSEELRGRVRGIAAMSAISAAFIDCLPKLEIIAIFGVGYDHVDARHAGIARGHGDEHARGALRRSRRYGDRPAAQHVREFSRAESWLRAGRWVGWPYPLTRATLRGRKVGILGMGRIGQAIARRLEGFGVPIAYHNRRPVEGVPYSLFPDARGPGRACRYADFGGARRRGDRKNRECRHLGRAWPARRLHQYRPRQHGRPGGTDAALRDGTILAAGLDVFAEEPEVPAELIALPNATLLPHVGSASIHTRDAMADLVVDNLVGWFQSGAPLRLSPKRCLARAADGKTAPRAGAG